NGAGGRHHAAARAGAEPARRGHRRDGARLPSFAQPAGRHGKAGPGNDRAANRNGRRNRSANSRRCLQIQTGQPVSAAARSGRGAGAKCHHPSTRRLGGYARDFATLYGQSARRFPLFQRHSRAGKPGFRSGTPGFFHRYRHVQKQRHRSRGRRANPAVEIHGRNRLPLSGASALSGEALRAGARQNRGRIYRRDARNLARGNRGRDNRNRRKVFPVSSRMKTRRRARLPALVGRGGASANILAFQKPAPLGFLLVTIFLSSCAAPDTRHQIVVSTRDQKLAVLDRGNLLAVYPVSTSKFGLGDSPGSAFTPLGELAIAKKIGDNAPPGAVFKDRRRTGEIVPPDSPGRDPIVTRILWLRGLEAQNANAFGRYIYIHGTPEERLIGTPASYGC